MKNQLTAWLIFFLFFALSAECYAIGRVYARLPNNASSPIYNLRIKSLKASAVIRDQLAVTTVDQEFTNDNSFRLEGFYIFSLPENAQVHEMYLWINGARVPYQIKKREDAVVKYSEIVTRMADPAILEQLGPNTFRLRIFPFDAHGTRRIEISYSQPLTYFKGKIQYTFPLDMKDYSSEPIETASLAIRFDSQFPITDVQTSVDQFPQAVKITRPSDRTCLIDYGVEHAAYQKDFAATFSLERGGASMSLLSDAAPDSLHEAPYFLLWCALPDSLVKDSVKAREITIVADVSSSMEGSRLAQLKESLSSFLDLLTEADRFNIIAFSTTTVAFRTDLVAATSAAKDSARRFIATLSALGLTNIEEALRKSLTESYTDNLRSAVLLVTDGQPTWGQTNTDSLLASTRRMNQKDIRIFPIGIGDEADYSLMQKIAKQEGGFFTHIVSDDSIYAKIRDLYRLLFLPQVKQIHVTFNGITASDLHPAVLPDIYAGDQLRLAGRFDKGAAATVTLTGTAGQTPVTLTQTLAFADTAASFPAVARYWGAQKIQSVLEMIQAAGEKKELVDQVIALSMRYSVLSPYTAFLIVEPSTPAGGTLVPSRPGLPESYGLEQNYPNPFNPSTTIRFRIPEAVHVTLKVYDALGREVAVLVNGFTPAGFYTTEWNASGLPSGVYFLVLHAGPYRASQKMLLQK